MSITPLLPRPGRRVAVALAVAAIAVLAGGGPAGADPARPTNFRSEVTSVRPAVEGVQVEVAGGDGFLDMRVDPGIEVVVSGYQNEPYLRFLKDGTVEENVNSPATYLNASRQGTASVPAALQGTDLPAPEWRKVATDGRYAWHDHRIHFMGSDPSVVAGLAEGEPVRWTVPFTVDGQRVAASGRYVLEDAPSPLPWLALAGFVAVGIALAGSRAPTVVGPIAAIVGAGAATWVGLAEFRAIPPGAGATPLSVVLPALALLAGIVGLVTRRRPLGAISLLAAAALLGGWVLTRASVLWKAVLPTDLAPAIDRAGTALALGTAIGIAVVVVRGGALAAPRPIDPRPEEEPTGTDPDSPAPAPG